MGKEKIEEEPPNYMIDELNDAFSQKDETSGVAAIKQIFDENNLMMKTELQPKEIHYYARLYVISKVLNLPRLKDFCDVELSLKISNARKGRREAVEISRQQPEPPRQRGLFGMFG